MVGSDERNSAKCCGRAYGADDQKENPAPAHNRIPRIQNSFFIAVNPCIAERVCAVMFVSCGVGLELRRGSRFFFDATEFEKRLGVSLVHGEILRFQGIVFETVLVAGGPRLGLQ
jgi:hypothetical protein